MRAGAVQADGKAGGLARETTARLASFNDLPNGP